MHLIINQCILYLCNLLQGGFVTADAATHSLLNSSMFHVAIQSAACLQELHDLWSMLAP